MKSYSSLAVIGGIIVLACLALAGVLLIQSGPESTQRLGLFFGVVGTIVAALIGMLKADQSQRQTNGSLDARIEDGVRRALVDRRSSSELRVPLEGPAETDQT